MTASDRTRAPQRAVVGPPRRLTVGLCLTIVVVAFESIAVATAMPAAARALGGLSYYSWSFSLFLVGMLFSTVLAGRFSDRIGPAKPLLMGLLTFVAGLLVAGTADVMSQLVAGRLVQGLGSGLVNTAIFVCVAQAYDKDQRPRIFTYISTAWVLPACVGPPVAAWLAERLGWQSVFLAVIPLTVLGGAMVPPSLRRLRQGYRRPETSSDGAPPTPLWAAALVATSAAALQLAGQRLNGIGLILLLGGLGALVLALHRLMRAGMSPSPGCWPDSAWDLPPRAPLWQ